MYFPKKICLFFLTFQFLFLFSFYFVNYKDIVMTESVKFDGALVSEHWVNFIKIFN